jgi:hypothetical protein
MGRLLLIAALATLIGVAFVLVRQLHLGVTLLVVSAIMFLVAAAGL